MNRFESMSIHEKRLRTRGIQKIGGIDEAGRGPLAGPVVAAACILPEDAFFPTLNDSKKLSSLVREDLYEKLTSDPRIFYGIGEASVEEIDELNILQATLLAMQRAVQKLPVTPDYLLIDGNISPLFEIPRETIIKGDGLSVSIAAASVLAKVFRDRLMEQMDKKWPEYGFKKHKGYGTAAHRDAIREWGACPIHRKWNLLN
jgi:ribonuclease HII